MKLLFLKKKLLLVIFILLLSVPIFQNWVYWFLVEGLGIGFAYSIDQFLPLIVTSIVAFIVTKKYIPKVEVKKYLSTNAIPILIIIITTLVVHGWVLGNYFFGEEPNSVLRPVNIGEVETPVNYLRGWHLGIYLLSFELFYTNVLLYNIVSLTLYIFTAVILYIFLNFLFNKRIMPALVGTLLFVTTPAYMDMFSWQINASGMPIALSAGILCLIFLLTYQKTRKVFYFFLSLMFYLSMLKISFIRMHAFIALPLYMCLLPNLSGSFRRPDFKKFVLSALPFLSIFLSYLLMVFLLPTHIFEKLSQGKMITSIGLKQISSAGYLETLSMMISYLFIPSETAGLYYPKIGLFLNKFTPGYQSITFILGLFIIVILFILVFLAIRKIRKDYGRLVLFSLIAIFANVVLTPIFIQSYGNIAGMDQRFSLTNPGNGPGLRYVFVSSFGLTMLVAAITYWIATKQKKYLVAFLIPIFLLFVYYGYLNVISHTNALKDIHPKQSAIPNNVFSMVPKDGKKKLLYSANPAKNAIDLNIGDWIHAFYELEELTYINSLDDVREKIENGEYEKNNFYAFYNNTFTQTFEDLSQLAKNEFYDKVTYEKIQLVQNVNLTTSFTETDNPTFPLILKRGILTFEDFNKRILSPRKLSLSVHKRELPVRFPYIDALRESPFPMEILDMLENKPFIVEQELSLALSVPSLNNRTINSLSSESRMKVAKSLKVGEMSDVEKVNKHYIDSQEILNIFLDNPSFNSLALVYACAEDVDWEMQKKSNNVIPGIWYVKELPLNSKWANEQLTSSLTCFGSILRQIVLIGPPVPSEITLQDVSLFFTEYSK